jgi:peptidoglycan/LPS O-acetylase OafA/YrhL
MPNRQPDAALRLVDVLRGSRMQIQSAEYPAGSLARFSTTYSPFIDGLRAISIVAVVGFHVGLPGFSGGFVGVDVFFVISGFLIINQIIAGLERGTFSLRDFWARRALRILPPLALVLAASILISSTALIFPRDIRDFGESVLYATAMAANHFFYDQQGYFDTGSDLKPLLHTWTLSVEEQFYVVAPLLLLALARIETAAKLRGVSLRVAILVFLASLIACVEYTRPSHNPAFFWMPFRAWEFIVGGMIVNLIPLARRLPAPWSGALAAFGLAAVVLSIVAYSDRLLYPSYLAVVPVFGAVMLITAGLVQQQAMIIRLLATRPFVWIGLVSYSWYLWHWPLLSFTRINYYGPHQIGPDILAVTFALMLAIITYRWVERPTRTLRSRSGSNLWLMGSVTALLLGFVGGVDFSFSRIALQRAQAEWAKSALPEKTDEWSTYGDACSLDRLPIRKLDPRCIDPPWIKSFGFLMGDSHAMTAFAGYREEMRKLDIQLITRVNGSCPPLLGTLILDRDVPMTSCMDGMTQALSALERELPDRTLFVILKASWTEVFGHPIHRAPPLPGASDDTLSVLTDRLRLTIETFQKMGVQRILIVGPEPLLSNGSLECLFRADHFGESRHICDSTRQSVEQGERPTIDAIFKATENFNEVRVIDAVAALCNEMTCPAVDASGPIYLMGPI